MLIYRFEHLKCCPVQEAVVIANNVEEALNIIVKETKREGWRLGGKYEIKKGLLFFGEADC